MKRRARTGVMVHVVPTGCACHWREYADSYGWWLLKANTNCTVHAKGFSQ